METLTAQQLAEIFKKTRITIVKYLKEAKLIPAGYKMNKLNRQHAYYNKAQAFEVLNKVFGMELE